MGLLGGSWVAKSRVISRVTILMTLLTGLRVWGHIENDDF